MGITFDPILGKLRSIDSGVQGPPGPKGDTGATGAAGADGLGITPQTVGFTLSGGTTPKTLTVALDGSVSGTNTGDQDLTTKVDKVTGSSLVSDTEIAKIHAAGSDNQDLSGKVDVVAGKGLSTNDFTDDFETKLTGIESGANNYTHPATHSADILTDGTTNKAYTATEQSKLSGIATSANNYALPTSSTTVLGGVKIGTRITITDGVISADAQTANDFTTVLKNKLDGIDGSANNYTHPASHSADIITDGTTNKVYTATEQSKLSGIATGAEVNVQSDWNQATNTADDYIKNKPTIPTVPTALSELSEDSTHRIVTDTEKSTWNSKAAGDHNHTGTYAPSSHTQAASTITDFDTEVSNNTDVSSNTSARHTHTNAVALAAVTNTNTGDQDLSVYYTKTEVDNLIKDLKAQMAIDKRVD